jgi:predicted dehydrogenase
MRIVPGLLQSSSSEPLAIASRTLESAQAFAGEFGIPRAYGSYEALLGDPDIEAVYIPLPNRMHVAHVRAAVERGKHVLCEKPMGVTAAEVAELLPLGEQRLVAEAFMVRFHPQWAAARERIRSGELGELRSVFARLDYAVGDPEDIRNRPEPGGGALFDLGGYGIVAARYFFEAEPVRVFAYTNGGVSGVPDRNVSAILDFGDNRHATLMASSETINNQRIEIAGTKARIALPNAIQPSSLKPAQMQIERLGVGEIETVPIAESAQYANEVEAFSQAVRGQPTMPYGIVDALANLRVIEALLRSAERGRWEHL